MSEKVLNHRVGKLERAVHKLEQAINAPTQQDHIAIAEQDDSEQKSEDAPRAATVISPSPTNSKIPKNKSNEAIPWWKVMSSRWAKIIQRVGILAGIGYAVITYLQWRDLRHNFSVEQRAWITLSTPSVTSFEMNGALHGIIRFTNTGKTPATDLEIDMYDRLVDPTANPIDLVERRDISVAKAKVIFPGEAQTFPIPVRISKRIFSPTPIIYTEDIREAIEAQKLRVVTFGEVSYNDAFGKRHWRKFCEFGSTLPPEAVHPVPTESDVKCGEYNDIDHN